MRILSIEIDRFDWAECFHSSMKEQAKNALGEERVSKSILWTLRRSVLTVDLSIKKARWIRHRS